MPANLSNSSAARYGWLADQASFARLFCPLFFFRMMDAYVRFLNADCFDTTEDEDWFAAGDVPDVEKIRDVN